MASCVQIRSLIQAYVDEELGSGEKLLLEEHLRTCDACRMEMNESRSVTAVLFEALQHDQLREDMTPYIMAHLPEMEASRRLTMQRIRSFSTVGKKRVPHLFAIVRLIPVVWEIRLRIA